ncbi:MAG: sulfatase-like hydrolase/transferase [bacterium]|nr:sulfatase-like hydrolase/transferase [bacterium]
MSLRLFVCCILVVCGVPAGAQSDAGVGKRPNVLVILVDQLSARTLGCYGNGFGGVSGSLTPELDRLAAEGVRFESATVAAPQCAPSRFALVTGRWPHATGLRWNQVWEPRDQTTIFDVARDAGYVTGTIGKHHFYWLDQPRPLSEDFGFDVVIDEDDYRDYCVARGVPTYAASGNFRAVPGVPADLAFTGYTFNTNEFHPAGYFADRTLDFLGTRAGTGGEEQPFFLVCSFIAPHTPLLPSGPADPMDWAHRHHPSVDLELAPNFSKVATTTRLAGAQARYAGLSEGQHKEILAYYYGLIAQVDWNIGRILRGLSELGLEQDTVVVFTSDHGEMATEMGCWLKGTGGYDAVTRVPLLVRFPGVTQAGLVSDALTTNIDLFPSLVELTGLPLTDAQRSGLDGRSLVDLLVGIGAPAGWPSVAFSELGIPGGTQGWHRAVRTRDHKYVIDEWTAVEEEYYELATDPWEIDDRILDPSPAVQATIQGLRDELDAWWNGAQDHAPVYAPTGQEGATPGRAVDPVPANGAQGVSRSVDPSWLPSTSADTVLVWLGSDPANLTLFATLPPLSDRFNPGTLAADTDYYWRVDQNNANGPTPGPVWHFRTAAGGPDGGDLATGPAPSDRATGVGLAPTLSWTVGPATTMQVLHFGPAGEMQQEQGLFPANQVTFDVGALTGGVRYEWRVDSYGDGTFTEGDVWSFTTSTAGLPSRTAVRAPLHLARDVDPVGVTLCWTPSGNAQSYDVHFGMEFPLALVGSRTDTSLDLPALAPATTYYWRVDPVGVNGSVRGFTWRFRTP